ncbi:GspH/FimT family pseudopilin [Thiothrix nivea]|uniref:Type II secretion system protein H n=1 Tax=Thiothrix nivea (strain ATCC 35100 / DSM 5205 / JP2) TaxID=870187 RepID=A0A656HI44_THINJ|nr:GspH/FimT family pseudopilin [Thiothrix nivea]EIJ35050.1 hypothetical protein Thini_2507 [Thiothrix nivea DSM 5205]
MNKPTQTGMTLIELIVTLSIVAILASVAAPSVKEMIQNNRLTALNNQIVSYLQYARSEAVTKNHNVSMCVRNTDGSGCTTNAADDFSNGWIVFDETTGEILKDNTPDTSGVTITNNFTTSQKITYTPSGKTREAGTFTMGWDGVNRYQIKIALNTGRISSCKIPEGDTSC